MALIQMDEETYEDLKHTIAKAEQQELMLTYLNATYLLIEDAIRNQDPLTLSAAGEIQIDGIPLSQILGA